MLRSSQAAGINPDLISKGYGDNMAKAGMRRPDPKEPHGTESNHKTKIPKNEVPPVPEIQGAEKHGK